MLCLNSTEAERSRGAKLAIDFLEGVSDFAKSRGLVLGTATVPFGSGLVLPGTNGNYATMDCASRFKASASIKVDCLPPFAANEGVLRHFCDTTAAARYSIYRSAANALEVYFGNTLVISTALANWTAYWLQDKRNVILAYGTTGANVLVLNGQSVGTSATAWTAANPATFYFGSDNGGLNCFAGKIRNTLAFTQTLTVQEGKDYFQS